MNFLETFGRPLVLAMASTVALASCGDSATGGGGSGGEGSSSVLRILVTNDDGVAADGIDAIVEALVADPNNEVLVSAPAENQSGSGDMTTEGDVEVTEATTAGGYPATAVNGFPADAVLYALDNLYPGGPPDLVVSGLNAGQNVGLLMNISGTVGAAKTAARRGVPAVAGSQGVAGNSEPIQTYDYPAGVNALLVWIAANRNALLNPTGLPTSITSINIPSCTEGIVRGALEVPNATSNGEYNPLGDQDCTSTLEDPINDIEAFVSGFTAVTELGLN